MDHLHEADLDIHDINYYSDWSYDIRWYCQHNKCNLYRFHEVKLFLENYEKTVKRIAPGIISQKVWNAITSRYIDNRDEFGNETFIILERPLADIGVVGFQLNTYIEVIAYGRHSPVENFDLNISKNRIYYAREQNKQMSFCFEIFSPQNHINKSMNVFCSKYILRNKWQIGDNIVQGLRTNCIKRIELLIDTIFDYWLLGYSISNHDHYWSVIFWFMKQILLPGSHLGMVQLLTLSDKKINIMFGGMYDRGDMNTEGSKLRTLLRRQGYF